MEEEHLAITQAPVENILPRFRIHFGEPGAVASLAESISLRLDPRVHNAPWVLLCIGTDRSTGDALGPLVGSKVAGAQNNPFHVYGTLSEPVHATNLKEKLREISTRHRNAFIIAIDASLGHLENVGVISVGTGPLLPGAGVHKALPPVGHLHITAVVNVGGFMEYVVLQNTRLHVVMCLAEVIAAALLEMAQRERKMGAKVSPPH
uniref:Spore protease YyaC n=1 Tax=Ammonifex degensii TaxID=42838 RepID=A0A7C2EJ50_9THEO